MSLRKLTQFAANEVVAAKRGMTRVVVYRDTDWDQYICLPFVFGIGGKDKAHNPAAYYTDDKADALATAECMATIC